MNEPETYKRIYDGGVIGYGKNKSDLAIKNIPLYTSDQLKNKIEMTKDEFELLAKVCRGIQAFKKIEKHIEVTPEKKWFVKLKKESEEFNMLYIDEQGFHYHQNKEYATYFDTKEEADLWTNPQTKAVLLPLKEK